MKYAMVTYKDDNRECGTIYWGVQDAGEARRLFRKEFPERADRELTVKVYN